MTRRYRIENLDSLGRFWNANSKLFMAPPKYTPYSYRNVTRVAAKLSKIYRVRVRGEQSAQTGSGWETAMGMRGFVGSPAQKEARNGR